MKPPKKLTNPYQAVEASDLGEGRHHTELLVSYSEVPDARMAQHLKKTELVHNWPSSDEVSLKNREIYEISSKSIRGKRVSLFLWNDSTADWWFRQDKRDEIMNWVKTAEPNDKFALAKWLVQKNGSGGKPCSLDSLSFLNDNLIQKEIEHLDLLHLREVIAMFCEVPRNPRRPDAR